MTGDTEWSGDIVLSESVLVPEGVTLVVRAGTHVLFEPSDTYYSGAEFISSTTEITVRGTLKIQGSTDETVLLNMKGDANNRKWGGIYIDGGSAHINHAFIENAETGIFVLRGKLNLKETVISNNLYGLVMQGANAIAWVRNSRITENKYGVFDLNNAKVNYVNSFIQANTSKDVYWYGTKRRSRKGMVERRKMSTHKHSSLKCRKASASFRKEYVPVKQNGATTYSNTLITGHTVWRGRIVVNGLVRIKEGARLVILPGTVIEFTYRDSDGDGIGEGGLLVDGALLAKGTSMSPIVFRSSQKNRQRGSWGSIIIHDNAGVHNIIEYAQIENAYIGIHVKGANTDISNSVLRHNFLAVSGENASLRLSNNSIHSNSGSVFIKDSKAVLTGNYVFENIKGFQLVKSAVTALNNYIVRNDMEGMEIHGGANLVTENMINCNRFGLYVEDTFFGSFDRNIILNSVQSGIALQGGDNIELRANFIQRSGFSGIELISAGAAITQNHISESGERGIDIFSFNGTISQNTIVNNRRFALENRSGSDLLTPMNWWGDRRADKMIFDKFDDPSRGQIIFSPALRSAVPYEWPFSKMTDDITWYGAISIKNSLYVTDGAFLTIKPGTTVYSAKDTGLYVSKGKFVAAGTEEKRILFTSLNEGASGDWDGIVFDKSRKSVLSSTDVEKAIWGVQANFTDIRIEQSILRDNKGGLKLKGLTAEILGSQFFDNRLALKTEQSSLKIRESEFFNNATGIYVHDNGGRVRIEQSNFYDNSDFSMKVGINDYQDIKASGNWWGPDLPVETMFDGRTDPGRGIVYYEPYLIEKLVFDDEEDIKGDDENRGEKGGK